MKIIKKILLFIPAVILMCIFAIGLSIEEFIEKFIDYWKEDWI